MPQKNKKHSKSANEPSSNPKETSPRVDEDKDLIVIEIKRFPDKKDDFGMMDDELDIANSFAPIRDERRLKIKFDKKKQAPPKHVKQKMFIEPEELSAKKPKHPVKVVEEKIVELTYKPPVRVPVEKPGETVYTPPVKVIVEKPAETVYTPPVKVIVEKPVETAFKPRLPQGKKLGKQLKPIVIAHVENPDVSTFKPPVRVPVETPVETTIKSKVSVDKSEDVSKTAFRRIPVVKPEEPVYEAPAKVQEEEPFELKHTPFRRVPVVNPDEISDIPAAKVSVEKPPEEIAAQLDRLHGKKSHKAKFKPPVRVPVVQPEEDTFKPPVRVPVVQPEEDTFKPPVRVLVERPVETERRFKDNTIEEEQQESISPAQSFQEVSESESDDKKITAADAPPKQASALDIFLEKQQLGWKDRKKNEKLRQKEKRQKALRAIEEKNAEASLLAEKTAEVALVKTADEAIDNAATAPMVQPKRSHHAKPNPNQLKKAGQQQNKPVHPPVSLKKTEELPTENVDAPIAKALELPSDQIIDTEITAGEVNPDAVVESEEARLERQARNKEWRERRKLNKKKQIEKKKLKQTSAENVEIIKTETEPEIIELEIIEPEAPVVPAVVEPVVVKPKHEKDRQKERPRHDARKNIRERYHDDEQHVEIEDDRDYYTMIPMPNDKLSIHKKAFVTYQVLNPERLMTEKQAQHPSIREYMSVVEKFLLTEMNIDDSVKLVLGVSGGVDSVVLLDIVYQLAAKYHFSLYIAHYNHNLRGAASTEDENFVKDLAASYKLPYHTANGNVKQYSEKNALSIETAARVLRYNFFQRTARNIDAEYFATAHTADDSAETFLINLLRGAGLTGLSGIPPIRVLVKNVMLVRPLINLMKTDLINYAKLRGLKWQEDETNALMFYTRNKVRLDLLPKLISDYTPAAIELLNRASRLIHGADELVNTYVKSNFDLMVGEVTPEYFELKIPMLMSFSPFVRGEMFQHALMKYFRLQPASLKTIDRIEDLIDKTTGSICEINKHYYVLKDRNSLVFARKSPVYKSFMPIERTGSYKIGNYSIILSEVSRKEAKFSEDKTIEYLDLDLVPKVLYLRSADQGDVFNPLGMEGSMKISDFLTNNKLSLIDKQNVVLLASKSDVIWVCGMQISDKFKVTPDTKKVLKVEIKTI